ncbi:hypothetical protein [Micromonospora carbonacea]|uniref:Uncharacterized protein n=1 Tax=Micromonospora carbonacea TaxID=47853 RepID=A0A1C5ABF4_9ACTN|nr:hypothetical protein [Micromonospora carbonacea]SCF42489.1 hypothetical protein GA0070563_11285 [Micromonospora carbonacea]
MIEMILGAMVVALWVKAVPAAVADAIATLRASKAGEWGLIDKERDRKAARSKARRDAIASIRSKRHKQAGGDGKEYRPGALAYLSDVYHGLWEDELEKRRAKRAARPPVGPDGKRPPVSRVDQAVEAKVRQQRAKTGYLGRAARALIDPVGESPQHADVPTTQICPVCLHVMTVGEECETCAFNRQLDQTTRQTLAEHDQRRAATTAEDGPRIACPTCGDNLIQGRDGWYHRSDSLCKDVRPGGGPDYPSREVTAPLDGGRQPGSTREASRDHDLDDDDDISLTGDKVIAGLAGPGGLFEGVAECGGCGFQFEQVGDELRCACSTQPTIKTPAHIHNTGTTDNGGTDMNTATGDVHDVESCKTELTALGDDLTRVDTALDVIDEAIRSAKAASEAIEAWLRDKNADACVPGMSAALDALSTDRIKELMDAVAAARRGVADTIDNLAPLEEAAELIGGTDGSALNGR